MTTTSGRRGLAYAIVYGGTGAIVVLLVVMLIQLRSLAEQNKGSLQLIEDCTTAGGECYERGRKNTAGVVEILNEFEVYVIACADRAGVQTVEEIRECALREAENAR